jgi:hypothetical protein
MMITDHFDGATLAKGNRRKRIRKHSEAEGAENKRESRQQTD